MISVAEIKMYGRFASGLRTFMRQRLTLESSRALVRRRLAQREQNLLRLLTHGIYGYPDSPYLPLLRHAGCELGDLRTLLPKEGVEGTLSVLLDAGVYVSFEEFKGRAPIRRGSLEVQAKPRAFDNPFTSTHFVSQSGGSTGAGTRVPQDIDHVAATAPPILLGYEAHGLARAPTALWRGVLPIGSGVNNVLRHVLIDNLPRRWFTPVTNRDLRPALKFRIANHVIVLAGRSQGLPIPYPEPVPVDDPGIIARWASEAATREGMAMVRTSISMALRIALAAESEGRRLDGVTFFGAGEPPTPAKVEGIRRTGARVVPSYIFSEAGPIGVGCVSPLDENDIHFFEDAHALIQHRRTIPGTDQQVDAFCFTSLLPTAPKLLLNVESDDFGVIERRACGCALEAEGYPIHLRHIRSFGKLTGEGMTLIGSEMVQILEDVLPSRLGGSALDYQLLQEEDEQGFTRLYLVVSPGVAASDQQIVQAMLEALGRGSVSADITRAVWDRAGTLRVRREAPRWTAAGKLMSLHKVGSG
jgi:hypothetical protein